MKTVLDVLGELHNRCGNNTLRVIFDNLSRNKVVIAGGFLRDVFAGDTPSGDIDIFYNKSYRSNIDRIAESAKNNGFTVSYVNMDEYNNIMDGNGLQISFGSKTDFQFIQTGRPLSDIIKSFDFTCNCISLDNLGIEQHVRDAIIHCGAKRLVEVNRPRQNRFNKFLNMGWK